VTAPTDRFADRHVGPDATARATMLAALGVPSLEALIDRAVPAAIRTAAPSALPPARTETEVLAALRALAARNTVVTSMIGRGYHGTVTPAVLRRNVLENPAWYTAYTPYQPEISQGRLEALLTFQQMVEDLTALPIAGASLLDEATAVVEAALLMRRAVKGRPDGAIVADPDLHPQVREVLEARCAAVGLPLTWADLTDGLPDALAGETVGVVVAQPGASGLLRDLAPLVEQAHAAGALVTVVADPLALTLITPPGEIGADVAVGTTQRFGVPMFLGGPHAAYIAVRAGLERTLPGRLVGVSHDADGATAFRLALQTREQHIRREKATCNICTNSGLCALAFTMHLTLLGETGLTRLAELNHAHAVQLETRLRRVKGLRVLGNAYFNEFAVYLGDDQDSAAVVDALADRGILGGVPASRFYPEWPELRPLLLLAATETNTESDMDALVAALNEVL